MGFMDNWPYCPRMDNSRTLTRTHISVGKDQLAEVKDRNLNLSAFVRDQLDEWSEDDA